MKKEVAPVLKQGKALETQLADARKKAEKAALLEQAAKVVLDRARKAAGQGVLLSEKERAEIANEVGGWGFRWREGRVEVVCDLQRQSDPGHRPCRKGCAWVRRPMTQRCVPQVALPGRLALPRLKLPCRALTRAVRFLVNHLAASGAFTHNHTIID